MGRLLIALMLFILHLSATFVYFNYVQTHVTDTAFYYFDRFGFNHQAFGLGTIFVVQFTQFLKHTFGATYLDSFLVFQTFGYWGLMLLMRLFQEIQIAMSVPESNPPLVLLFLPSLQFWTAAPGKDAALFFAVCLCAWSVMKFGKRMLPFSIGLAVMVFFRAHIALITVMSLAIAALIHGRMTIGRKFILLTITVGGAVILISAVNSSLNLDVTSSGSLASFYSERDQIAASTPGTTSIGDAPYYVRLFSLLFRPLFVDASGGFGLIPSIENLGSIALFAYLLLNWNDVRVLTRHVFYMRFALAFSIIVILLLASVNYNLGLGIRQRIMALPTLLSILVALWAVRQHRFGVPNNQYGAKMLRPAAVNEPVTEGPQ